MNVSLNKNNIIISKEFERSEDSSEEGLIRLQKVEFSSTNLPFSDAKKDEYKIEDSVT